MPVKSNLTKDVKCRCGKTTTVNVVPATIYVEITRFICECGKIVHVCDYYHGITSYSFPSEYVDGEFIGNRQVEALKEDAKWEEEKEAKMREMEVVSFTVVCKKGDGENIAHEMMNSDLAQMGIYSWGANVREANPDEVNEVIEQTPPEYFN